MGPQRFSTGKQFNWQGEPYEVKQLWSGSQLTIVNLKTNEGQIISFMRLYQALLADELQFVPDNRLAKRSDQRPGIDLSDYPVTLRTVAEYRFAVILPLLDLPPHQRRKAIKLHVQEMQDKRTNNEPSLQTAISEASVYRWLSDYLGSGGDIRVLIPNTHARGGTHKSRLDPEVEALIKAVIEDFYYRRETKTVDYLYYEIAVRIKEANQQRPPHEQLKTPSRATVARRIEALDGAGKLVAKRGKQIAKRELTQYRQIDYPTLPLEKVEIDHTPVDLIVIDEEDCLPLGRLTLTYCLDTATRYPLGYYLGFEPPSYLSVMECLYHAILPKAQVREQYQTVHDWLAHGIPYQLVVDNAKEFIGRDLDDACLSLGIILERTPVKTPHFKAAVERMFGTMNTGLLHGLPGTTFSNPGQRGDYQSLKQACISLNELEKILHVFLLDQYAQSFHRGLQGIPNQRWEAAISDGFFPRVPISAEELRILLGRVAYRTVQPYGIELFALRYQADELTALRTRMLKRESRQVKVKYHPADLSRIYAFDPDEQRHIEVPALAQDYTANLSLWKHNVIRHFVLSEQDTVDIVALGEAQRKIQAMVEESLSRKKQQTRTRVARWKKSGHTPSLSEGQNHLEPDGGGTTDQTTTQSMPSVFEQSANLDLETLDETGWSVSYDLPDTYINEGGRPDDA